ncbi:hypothetical protein Cni_G01099 [Canna indica]|uniref:Uncharacterized protein n=1 Tax=Canna indica TaxID=4628 RepID=A0AAQ3PY70_9LILI|nr:hypothetical protein Cni_G01099 [Canna indica]
MDGQTIIGLDFLRTKQPALLHSPTSRTSSSSNALRSYPPCCLLLASRGRSAVRGGVVGDASDAVRATNAEPQPVPGGGGGVPPGDRRVLLAGVPAPPPRRPPHPRRRLPRPQMII